MQTAMEKELARIESMTDMQLITLMEEVESLPVHLQTLIMRKVNAVMNDRIGLGG